MSDNTIASVVGGVIGAVLAIPTGGLSVGAGFAIGSAIGGLLVPPEGQDVTGPRRDDLKVQTSSYGQPLPFLYGTTQIAGNVIWLENNQLKEVKEEEEVGGKGGGGSTQTTFTYFATFAVSLCEGEIGGIRRIWADADLIYDHSTDVSASALYGGANVMVEGDTVGDGARIIIYRGTQTQTPHGRIESDKGVAPAYRGTAYIVVEDFPLNNYGNRIPSIRVELVKPTVSDIRPTLVEIVRPAWPGVDQNKLQPSEDWGRVDGDTVVVNVNPDSPDHDTKGASNNVDYVYSVDGNLVEQRLKSHPVPDDFTYHYAGEWVTTSRLGEPTSKYHVFHDVDFSTDVHVYVEDDSTDGLKRVHVFEGNCAAVITPTGNQLYVIRVDTDGSNPRFERYDADVGYLDPQESGKFVSTSGGNVPSSLTGNGGTYAIAIEASGDRAWWMTQLEITLFERDANGDFAVVNRVSQGTNQGDEFTVMADGGICWVFYKDYLEIWTAQSLIDAQSYPLQSIVEDLTTRSGLDASEVDASALSDDVRGYTVSRVTAVRNPLSQLRRIFPFDVRQNGYKIEFVPRGQSSVVTLTDDDLGAHELGQEPPAVVKTTRTLETQLPKRVHLTYEDFDRNYEAGNQYADRITTRSDRILREDLPIVLTAGEAAKAADVILRDVWANQESLNAVASWQQIALQAADVVTLNTTPYSGLARITQLDDGRPGLIKLSLTPEDAGFYNSNAEGDGGDGFDDTIAPLGPTLYELMDLPALRDQDTGGGFYLAMTGTEGWPGAQLFRSEAGEIYNTRTASTVRAVMGHTVDVLADGPTTIWDRGNSVNVTVTGGTLSSKTELEVLNGANRAAISTTNGWELIGFADAVLESDGSYTLSTLLRGLRGTEWATAGHATRDRFVFLSTNGSIQRVDRILDSIGTEYFYKAVTIGSSLFTATERAFTYNGENLEPYSPVHVRGSRASNGDLTIEWVRRTRIGGAWRNNTGVTLSEETESYELDVMNGSTVARTITGLSSPTTTYTAADQITDFGSVQPSVTIRVYQISAEVGRGRKAEATI